MRPVAQLTGHQIHHANASKKGKWPLNYGTVICQETCRMLVHDPEVKIEGPQDSTTLFELRAEAGKDGVNGWSESRSNLAQMNQITAHLDEGLRQGALGIGSTGRTSTAATTRKDESRGGE